MTRTLMSGLKGSCSEQGGRWPRSQPSYPRCLQVKWDQEFSGDTQNFSSVLKHVFQGQLDVPLELKVF